MKKKKVSNFFKCLFNNRTRKNFFVIGVLLLSLLITITLSVSLLSESEEVKSVEFDSKGWSSQEPGSWHISKSAEWTGLREARITFNVDTLAKISERKKDIILVLDISGSMSGSRIEKVKEDSIDLINVILSDNENKIALISFDTDAKILSEFTNDKEALLNTVESLEVTGATNYTDALRKVDTILKNYENYAEHDLTVLFLSDGWPCVETPNQVAEYASLKEKYPYMILNAIQYEMGNTIIEELKEISDNQFSANSATLQNVLFEASSVSATFDKFVIEDYIEEKYFELGTIENVEVSIGEALLSNENSLEKITWNLGDGLQTGTNATMTINIKLKDSTIVDKEGMLFPTNRKEKIVSKLPDEENEIIESSATPKLYNGFNVIYDANPPTGCNIKSDKEETYWLFEKVTINNEDLSGQCPGYLFKGWEMTDESSIGVEKINDESFIMPNHNVYIKGTWTQVSISKYMTGEEASELSYVLPFNDEDAYLDNKKSTFVTSSTGIDFNESSSDTNGKGLYVRAGTENDEYPIFYYRGDVDNNNVLFANKCWKIVRTTETGGTKLIYNGEPNENNANGICANFGSDSILENIYYDRTKSLSSIGYMRSDNENILVDSFGSIIGNLNRKTVNIYTSITMNSDDNYYFSTDYVKVGDSYKLVDAKQLGAWSSINSKMTGEGYFTCKNTNSAEDTCSTLYYVRVGLSKSIYAMELNNSQNFEQVNTNITLGSEIIINSDGSATLSGDIVTFKKFDWYTRYSNLEDYYICADLSSTTCSEIYKIVYKYSDSFSHYDNLSKAVFGKDIDYDEVTRKYILKDTIVKKAGIEYDEFLNSDKSKGYHYTCSSINDTCETVYYIYYHDNSFSYSQNNTISLKNGMTIEEFLKFSFSDDNNTKNETDSTIKDYIENTWFSGTNGMLSYNEYLEDTVWCNNRDITHLGSFSKNSLSFNDLLYFGKAGKKYLNYEWTPAVKSVDACPNQNDWFTVSSDMGNGKSKYKVGLITIDEAILAGNKMIIPNDDISSDDSVLTYLNRSNRFWTLSPAYIGMYPSIFVVQVSGLSEGILYGNSATGVRPSVSLKQGVIALGGDGSTHNPYRVG